MSGQRGEPPLRAAFSNSESNNRAINSGGEEPTRVSLCRPYPLTITMTEDGAVAQNTVILNIAP